MAGGNFEYRQVARDSAARATARRPVIPSPFCFILLGTPGAGKGTQAALMRERLGTRVLSAESLVRSPVSTGEEGPESPFAGAGNDRYPGNRFADGAVVDFLSPELVDWFRCSEGFTLEDFPRTVAEAEAFAELLANERLQLTAVLNLELSTRTAEFRLTGRRVCGDCGAVYHRARRPERRKGVCDQCGGAVGRRDGDRPEAVRKRLEVYEREAAPLIEYYSRRAVLVTIEAAGSPEEVFQRTEFKLLNALPAIA